MFMTGFYSKDFILESAYGQYYFSGTVVYIIATIGAMFTTLYSVKVLYLTFLTNPNGPLINYKQAHEGDIFMSLPLMILAVFSIFFGFITKDMFIGLGSGFFSDNALFIHPSHEIMLDTEFGVPTLFKLLPLIFTISLSVIAIVLSEYLSTILIYFKLSRVGYNIFSFFNQRFLIELFYNRYITGIILKLGGQTTKVIDKGSVEYLGPHGLEKGLLNISNNIARLNTGVITSYALYTLIGVNIYLLNSYINDFIIMLTLILSLSLLFNLIGNNQSIMQGHILQSSTINSSSNNNMNNSQGSPNSESESESDYDEDESDSSGDDGDESDFDEDPRVTDKNEKDLAKVENLHDEREQWRDLFVIAEKIRDRDPLTHQDLQLYSSSGSPSLDQSELRIRENTAEMHRLEQKMAGRRNPDYQLSPETNPASPESNVPTDLDMDNVESALPILIIVSTEIPVVSLLCISYKLYKLDFFKILRSFLKCL